MNTLQTLLLLSVGLSVGQPRFQNVNLLQFRNMIRCVMPNSRPIRDYADYGCYCGLGGSGTPVDDLDMCCKVHDECYGTAVKDHCSGRLDPYINWYRWFCNRNRREIACNYSNDECEMFICKCDREASKCFARSTRNPENENLPRSRCQPLHII